MKQLTLSRIWRHFGMYVTRQSPILIGAFITLLAEIIWRLAEPWALKFVIDYVIGKKSLLALPFGAQLATIDSSVLLIAAALGIVLVTAMRAMSEYVNTVSFALAGNAVLNGVRAKLYHHLQRMSLAFHTKSRNGDLVVRISSDINQLTDAVVTAALPLAGNVLVMVGMLGMMLWMNWRLALLAFLVLPLFWLMTTRYGSRIQDAARKQRKREGALAATASESFSAIKIVQALGLERVFAEAFEQQNVRSLSEGARSTRLTSSLERSVDVMLAAANALVIWLGARMVLNSELSVGDLLVFLSYLKSTLKPIQDFAKYTGRLAKAGAAGERVIDLLDQEPDVRNLPHAKTAPAFRGHVCFDQVGFGYEAGNPILKDISFVVKPGQRVAIIGPSGNGKTTLTNLLMRLYDPTTGHVLIDQRDVRAYTIESLRAQISVVMQDTILFAGTLRENIAFGVPDATQEAIEAAARVASAHDFIVGMPLGYDTEVGERGVTLSNGQRQRISIARAAIRRAPILILDEPTTGLDKTNERAVLAALEKISAGSTTFYITHDLTHIKPDDMVLYLDAGELRVYGPHASLIKTDNVYSHQYRQSTGATVAADASHAQFRRPAAPPVARPA